MIVLSTVNWVMLAMVALLVVVVTFHSRQVTEQNYILCNVVVFFAPTRYCKFNFSCQWISHMTAVYVWLFTVVEHIASHVAGSVSESVGMPTASGSRITPSKPLPVDAESSLDKEQRANAETQSVEWADMLADIYPLIKIMEVQVCNTFLLYFSFQCKIALQDCSTGSFLRLIVA